MGADNFWFVFAVQLRACCYSTARENYSFCICFLWFVRKWLKNPGELRHSEIFQVPLKVEVLQMGGF